jgi:hypothetical protein
VPKIDPTILTAVFGLLGVIVGGLITGAVTYFVEEQRANRDETKERQKRLTDLKRAARLIHEDFIWALISINLAIDTKHWTGPEHDPIRLQTWKDYRSVLAAETNLADWIALQRAVRAMERYQGSMTGAIRRDEAIDALELQNLEAYKEALEEGREALKPFLDLAIE